MIPYVLAAHLMISVAHAESTIQETSGVKDTWDGIERVGFPIALLVFMGVGIFLLVRRMLPRWENESNARADSYRKTADAYAALPLLHQATHAKIDQVNAKFEVAFASISKSIDSMASSIQALNAIVLERERDRRRDG